LLLENIAAYNHLLFKIKKKLHIANACWKYIW